MDEKFLDIRRTRSRLAEIRTDAVATSWPYMFPVIHGALFGFELKYSNKADCRGDATGIRPHFTNWMTPSIFTSYLILISTISTESLRRLVYCLQSVCDLLDENERYQRLSCRADTHKFSSMKLRNRTHLQLDKAVWMDRVGSPFAQGMHMLNQEFIQGIPTYIRNLGAFERILKGALLQNLVS